MQFVGVGKGQLSAALDFIVTDVENLVNTAEDCQLPVDLGIDAGGLVEGAMTHHSVAANGIFRVIIVQEFATVNALSSEPRCP